MNQGVLEPLRVNLSESESMRHLFRRLWKSFSRRPPELPLF